MGGGRHLVATPPEHTNSIEADGQCHCNPCNCKHKFPERSKVNADLQRTHWGHSGKGEFTTTSSDFKILPIPDKSEFTELKKSQVATHFKLGSNNDNFATTHKEIYSRPNTVPVVNEGRKQQITNTSHIFKATDKGEMVSTAKISFQPIEHSQVKVQQDKSLGVFLRNSHFQIGHGNKEMSFATDTSDNYVPPPYVAKLDASPQQVFAGIALYVM